MTIEISNFSYERDLKNALIAEIPSLFPGYKIFGNNPEGVRAMETIKSTIQLVFLPGFRVAPMGTYSNMLPLARLETRQKFGALLVDFKISMALKYRIEGKYIDVLLEKENHLKAIELKAGVADFKAFGQLSMYLGLLQNRFPEKIIKGVIIAGAIDESLKYASITNKHVQLKTYQMKLLLDDA